MSTRGLTGFIADGKWYAMYNHGDSYPEWLGMRVLEFCKQVEDWNALKENVKELTLVNDDQKPTIEEAELYKCYHENPNETVLGHKKQEITDWYWLLHSLQGEGILYEINKGNLKHLIDDHDFIEDSLFCEWAYIIDLDEMELKVYKGFNTEEYPDTPLPDDVKASSYEVSEGYTIREIGGKETHHPETHYYPCRMLYAYSLYKLPKFMLGVTNEFKKQYREEHQALAK